MDVRFALALGVACIGCFSKPPAPSRGDANATADAQGDGDVPPDVPPGVWLCQIDDDFEDTGSAPCGTWGQPSAEPPRRASGVLQTTPTNLNDSSCTSMPLTPSGTVSIELAATGFDDDGNYAFFDLLWPANQVTLNVYRNNGNDEVNVACPSSTTTVTAPYSSIDHRYFRFRMTAVSPSDVAVAVEPSPDGSTYTAALLNCVVPGVAALPVTIRVGTGVDVADAVPPITWWDRLHFDCTP